MKKFEAVLFDLDGTLARTMEQYFIAWRDACRDFGFEIKKSDYFPLEGMQALELACVLCRKCGADLRKADLVVERKKHYFINAFSCFRPAELYPGAEAILNVLCGRGIKIAVVTASVKEQVDASIPKKFLEKFNAIVTGENAGRGKPYPDPYLKAAEILGVHPKNCIGVENAPLGVCSVKSAGMYCIALSQTVSKDELKEADVVLSTLEELPKFFHNVGI